MWPECWLYLTTTFALKSHDNLHLVTCQFRACRSHQELQCSHFPLTLGPVSHLLPYQLESRPRTGMHSLQVSPSFSFEFCLFVCLTETELRSLSRREWRKGGREHWLWSVTSNSFFMTSPREKHRSPALSLVKWLTWEMKNFLWVQSWLLMLFMQVEKIFPVYLE